MPTQDDSDFGEDVLELVSSSGGGLYKSPGWLAAFACPSLTCLEFDSEVLALLWDRPNQWGKPCRRLNPPGRSRSSSVALTVSELEEPVVYVYVVNGATKGWKMSLMKIMAGGRIG